MRNEPLVIAVGIFGLLMLWALVLLIGWLNVVFLGFGVTVGAVIGVSLRRWTERRQIPPSV